MLIVSSQRFTSAFHRGFLAAIAMSVLATSASAQILDPELSPYRPVNDLKGEVTLMGSTTMTNIASAWADSFQQFYPNVQKKLEIRGSAGAVPAVMSGEATFGLLSRKVYESEVTAFTEKFGYAPKVITSCLEHIAIYVHPENPIGQLTLVEIQSVMSGKVKTWGELGVEGPWAAQPIRVHGRQPATGSRVFLQQALRLGETHKPAYEHKSNEDLVNAVAQDKLGFGYAGLIFKTGAVKDVPVAFKAETPAVKVDSLAAAQGQYPLMRPLQLVFNQKPGTKLPAAAEAFIDYVVSRAGQEDVIRSGFQPIDAARADIAHETADTGIVR